MKVLISGGTGMIGRVLCDDLITRGDQVFVLSRVQKTEPSQVKYHTITWDQLTSVNEKSILEGIDAVIHLAGENIGSGRWTAKKKKRILSSRLETSQALIHAISLIKNKPEVFIQASAIGIYGTAQNQIFTENSPVGDDYLSTVAKQWEESSKEIEKLGIRRVVIRSGVVLKKEEGALVRMLLPFRLFLGGALGSGRQWISWIHIEDEVRAIEKILQDQSMQGIVNLTSPNPVTNAAFGKSISKVIHRPYWINVPAFSLKLLLGEMSIMVLDGQKVIPQKLEQTDFTFKYPDIETALQNLLT